MNPPPSPLLSPLEKIAEIKRIFTAIQVAADTQANLCLIISSGARREGKTTVAAGLAMAAAQSKRRRTLLVDYNWHAPAVHACFGVALIDKPETFYNADSIEALTVHTDTGVDILPAVRTGDDCHGILSPAEGHDHHLIHGAKQHYDTIIIDTSAVFPENQRMRDPILLTSVADGVVLVFMTNRTPRSTLKRTTTVMRTHGAKIFGVVANQWKNSMVHA